jgi:hypothetical protein
LLLPGELKPHTRFKALEILDPTLFFPLAQTRLPFSTPAVCLSLTCFFWVEAAEAAPTLVAAAVEAADVF